jgi:hypothetical protein
LILIIQFIDPVGDLVEHLPQSVCPLLIGLSLFGFLPLFRPVVEYGLSLSVILTAKALDLLAGGGFVFIAERYIKELERANLEFQQLQADAGSEGEVKKIANISGIISNLITAAQAIVMVG